MERYRKKQKQGQKKEYNNFFVKLSVSNSGLDSKWHPLELTYFVTILKTLNGTCQNSGHKRKWSNMIYVFIVSFFKVYFNSIFSHTKKDGFSTVLQDFVQISKKWARCKTWQRLLWSDFQNIIQQLWCIFFPKIWFKWVLIFQNST